MTPHKSGSTGQLNIPSSSVANGNHRESFPGLRNYLSETRRIADFAVRGDFRTSWNRTRSLMTNIWNFQLNGGQANVECPCCGWRGPAFLSMSTWRSIQDNSKCPRCSSRSRHRGLTLLLPEIAGDKPDGPGLVFAPEKSLLSFLQQLIGDPVMTTDYQQAGVDFPGEDIQHLSFEDNTFAFLMCNHVLEHIPDDRQALRECARVLVPGGIAVFTIPGDFDKPETWYFDQPDSTGHLRHYGLDVVEKMSAAGFESIRVIDMSEGRPTRYCIRLGDMAFVCRK